VAPLLLLLLLCKPSLLLLLPLWLHLLQQLLQVVLPRVAH
jgi:hypothetical protein